MKSSGPCLPSLSATPLRAGCPPSVPSLPLPPPPLRRPTVGAPRLLRGEGDMRLVPLERKRCHFLHAIFLAPTIVRSFPVLPSPTLLDLSVPPRVLARLIPLGINPPSPSLSIFCKRIPDFLIAINVRPIAAPFAALACSNVSAPRFSCLKFRSYPHALIPAYVFLDFFPIEIDACLFASLSPRVHAPVPLPRPTSYSFDLPFRRASPRKCA